jgi:AcrR family transcriptional regulator
VYPLPYARTGKGRKTRRRILRMSLHLATMYGLNGLSLSRLAMMLYMTKSGILAHFRCKRDLQYAIVAKAAARFRRTVFGDCRFAEGGAPCLYAILDGWFDYIETKRPQGGCFFFAASAEVDALAEHPCREVIAELTRTWYERLHREIVRAQKRGHLAFEVNTHDLAFEMHALLLEANWATQLHAWAGVMRARGIVRRRLGEVLTPDGKVKVREFIRARPLLREAAAMGVTQAPPLRSGED